MNENNASNPTIIENVIAKRLPDHFLPVDVYGGREYS